MVMERSKRRSKLYGGEAQPSDVIVGAWSTAQLQDMDRRFVFAVLHAIKSGRETAAGATATVRERM